MPRHSKKSHQPSESGMSLVELNISELTGACTQLANYLKESAGQATETCREYVDAVVQQVERIQQMRKEHGAESEPAEITQAYQQAVDTLRDAARGGQQECADALRHLGEKIESLGKGRSKR